MFVYKWADFPHVRHVPYRPCSFLAGCWNTYLVIECLTTFGHVLQVKRPNLLSWRQANKLISVENNGFVPINNGYVQSCSEVKVQDPLYCVDAGRQPGGSRTSSHSRHILTVSYASKVLYAEQTQFPRRAALICCAPDRRSL